MYVPTRCATQGTPEIGNTSSVILTIKSLLIPSRVSGPVLAKFDCEGYALVQHAARA